VGVLGVPWGCMENHPGIALLKE